MLMLALVPAAPKLVHFARDRSTHDLPWWGYVVIAFIYSALAFRDDAVSDSVGSILSGPSSKPILEIVVIHSTFLAILLCIARIDLYLQPLLPGWMTDPFQVRSVNFSITDILFVLLMVVMHFIERRWLVRKSEASISDLESGSGQSSRITRK